MMHTPGRGPYPPMVTWPKKDMDAHLEFLMAIEVREVMGTRTNEEHTPSVRWNSSRDIAAQQEHLSRMLEGFYGRPQEDLARGAWVPAVDIHSNGRHELVLKAELPDMKEDEIGLTVEDNTLTLRGEKKVDSEVTDEQFHRIETLPRAAKRITLRPEVQPSRR